MELSGDGDVHFEIPYIGFGEITQSGKAPEDFVLKFTSQTGVMLTGFADVVKASHIHIPEDSEIVLRGQAGVVSMMVNLTVPLLTSRSWIIFKVTRSLWSSGSITVRNISSAFSFVIMAILINSPLKNPLPSAVGPAKSALG